MQLDKAASQGLQYGVLLALGTFIGVVIEGVWVYLLRNDQRGRRRDTCLRLAPSAQPTLQLLPHRERGGEARAGRR